MKKGLQLVRHIYERYLAHGTVRLLKKELDQQGISTPKRLTVLSASLVADLSPGDTYTRY